MKHSLTSDEDKFDVDSDKKDFLIVLVCLWIVGLDKLKVLYIDVTASLPT